MRNIHWTEAQSKSLPVALRSHKRSSVAPVRGTSYVAETPSGLVAISWCSRSATTAQTWLDRQVYRGPFRADATLWKHGSQDSHSELYLTRNLAATYDAEVWFQSLNRQGRYGSGDPDDRFLVSASVHDTRPKGVPTLFTIWSDSLADTDIDDLEAQLRQGFCPGY